MKPFAYFALLCLGIAPAVAAAAECRIAERVSPEAVSVFASGLERVDNIKFSVDGQLYATLERDNGKGAVVRISGNSQEAVGSGFERADGLLLEAGRLTLTEEVSNGGIYEISIPGRKITKIAQLQKPEGIVRLDTGQLAITEDLTSNGRLVTLDDRGETVVLLDGLEKPEGLVVTEMGALLVAESGTGRILKWHEGNLETLISGLHEPDQIAYQPGGTLWITEDREEGRLLRYQDGKLETILEGLSQPQGIAFDADGCVYVAEQGRDRILKIEPK